MSTPDDTRELLRLQAESDIVGCVAETANGPVLSVLTQNVTFELPHDAVVLELLALKIDVVSNKVECTIVPIEEASRALTDEERQHWARELGALWMSRSKICLRATAFSGLSRDA